MEITKHLDVGRLMIDMDGCIAYCSKGISDLNHIPIEKYESFSLGDERHEYWMTLINSGGEGIREFFSNLPYEPNAQKLIRWIDRHENIVNPHILSKPIREPNSAACIAGKEEWLEKKGITWPAIFEARKYKYARHNGIPNVLIDDLDTNIEQWNRSGGIGILYDHRNVNQVIKQLEDLYRISK